MDGVDEAVLLDEPEDGHGDRHQPLPPGGHAGPPHREEADRPADGGGQPQVEEDDRLLHPLGDELGGDHARGRGEAGQADHDVAWGVGSGRMGALTG